MQGEHVTIQLLWAAARLLVPRFQPCLPSGWVLLQVNKNMVSVQDYISLYLWLVVWIRKIRMLEEVKIPLCNPRWSSSAKTVYGQNVDCFCKIAPLQTSNGILNADLTRGVVNVGCGVNVFAWNSCCAGKWLRLYKTIRKSYFWWYSTCVDSIENQIESNQIEKDLAYIPPRPV